jgi:hypothetical protein
VGHDTPGSGAREQRSSGPRRLGSVAAGDAAPGLRGPREDPPLWHLRLTFAGEPVDVDRLARSLRTLVDEQPFLATVRYAADRAEISYWDEADDIDDAAALGLRLWSEHRRSADLPDWHPVGLEVVDRETLRARGQRMPQPSSAGDVRPL